MSQEDGQESAGASYTRTAQGPDRMSMVETYLPDQDDWDPKTVLDVNDPARVAALRNMGRMFPTIAHHQDTIDDFLDNYLKARTSVGGRSRRDYRDIFMSMFGGRPQDDDNNMLAAALAADLEDDD